MERRSREERRLRERIEHLVKIIPHHILPCVLISRDFHREIFWIRKRHASAKTNRMVKCGITNIRPVFLRKRNEKMRRK